MELSKLGKDKAGKISRILTDDSAKVRMAELGLIEGVAVRIIRFAPFGDPIMIKVREVYLAIRKSDADKIMVETI